MGDRLLDNDGIITGSPLRNTVDLALANDIVQVDFEPSRNQFGNDLVLGIT